MTFLAAASATGAASAASVPLPQPQPTSTLVSPPSKAIALYQTHSPSHPQENPSSTISACHTYTLLSFHPDSSVLSSEALRRFKITLLKGKNITTGISEPQPTNSVLDHHQERISSQKDNELIPKRNRKRKFKEHSENDDVGDPVNSSDNDSGESESEDDEEREDGDDDDEGMDETEDDDGSHEEVQKLPFGQILHLEKKRLRAFRHAIHKLGKPSKDVEQDEELSAYYIARSLVEFTEKYAKKMHKHVHHPRHPSNVKWIPIPSWSQTFPKSESEETERTVKEERPNTSIVPASTTTSAMLPLLDKLESIGSESSSLKSSEDSSSSAMDPNFRSSRKGSIAGPVSGGDVNGAFEPPRVSLTLQRQILNMFQSNMSKTPTSYSSSQDSAVSSASATLSNLSALASITASPSLYPPTLSANYPSWSYTASALTTGISFGTSGLLSSQSLFPSQASANNLSLGLSMLANVATPTLGSLESYPSIPSSSL